MSEFIPAEAGFNRQNGVIRRVEQQDIHNSKLQGFSEEARDRLNRAAPEYNSVAIPNNELLPKLEIASYFPNGEQWNTRGAHGVISLAGGGGTGRGTLHPLIRLAEEMQAGGGAVGVGSMHPSMSEYIGLSQEDRDKYKMPTRLVASVGNIQSLDTQDQPPVYDIIEKAKVQALAIVEWLKNNPVDNLWIIGYSAADPVTIVPIIEKLLPLYGLDSTKIAGVLVESGGKQFERKNRADFALKFATEVGSLSHEITWLFPTVVDIEEVRSEMLRAREIGRPDEEVRSLWELFKTMHSRYYNPDIPDRYKGQLAEFNQEIEDLYEKGDEVKLEKVIGKRKKFLKPFMQNEVINGGDARPNPPLNLAKNLLRLAKDTLWKDPITKQLPGEIRSRFKSKIGYINGGNDPLFKADKAYEGMFYDEEGNETTPVPNASKTVFAFAPRRPHIMDTSDPEESSKATLKVMQWLHNETEQPDDSNHRLQVLYV